MPSKSKTTQHEDLIVIGLDKLCKAVDDSKDASSAMLEYLRHRSSLEHVYADKLQALSSRFASKLPPYWSPVSDLVKHDMVLTVEKHRALAQALSKDIEQPFRGVLDEVNLRQTQTLSFVDEIVRLSPGFVIPAEARTRAVQLGEKALAMERTRYEKLQYGCGFLSQALKSFHSASDLVIDEAGLHGLKSSFDAALAAMPIVADSRWKPHTEIVYEPAADARFDEEEAGWDTEAHSAFPTLADNPAAAAVVSAMPDVSSLNILVDHMVVEDFKKPIFHQPTRNLIRNALLVAIKKEADGHGVKFDDLEFYRVIGNNQSAHVALPTPMVNRMVKRLANQLGFRHETKAAEASVLTNYADIRVKQFKKPGELTKTMTKADRTTENFRVGAEMLKKMGNLGQFDRLVSFDLEGWELGSHLVTELGVAIYDIVRQTTKTHHFIIEENAHLKNGNIMPNHRDRFQYGSSVVKPLREAFQFFADTLEQGSNTAVVGHGMASDITMILNAGLPRLPIDRLVQIDTQVLFLQMQRCADQSSLEKVLEHFKIPAQYLHNAGNDAFYTLMICLRIAGVDTEPYLKNKM